MKSTNIKNRNTMKRKKYETPSMKQYDIQPTRILAGSNEPGTGKDGDDGGYASIFHPSADDIMA